MKRQLIALLLALMMVASLAACGSKNNEDPVTPPEVSAPAEGDTSTEAGSAEGSGEPEQEPETLPADPEAPAEPENAPADSSDKTESQPAAKPSGDTSAAKPQPKPETKPQPETKPETKPEPEPETKPEAPAVDLKAFYDGLTADENFPALMALEGEALDTFYAGLSELSPKQCIVGTPMISAVAAELSLVEVANSDDVQKVKDIFQARIDYQIEQGAWYPATVEAWKSNAKIVTNGNCVMLICMDPTDDIVTAFNALFA